MIPALRITIAGLVVASAPTMAQVVDIDPGTRLAQLRTQGEGLRDAATTGSTGVGEVGQRQARSDAAPNIKPLGRIENRIENRVQNRLQNRIDRDYDPVANATAPFERANDRAREATRPRS